jgi:phosphoserine phosphatase/putative flippase GtrA
MSAVRARLMVDVYDFDRTIYRGDASIEFIRFVLARHPRTWASIPRLVVATALYVIGVVTRTRFKAEMFSVLGRLADVDATVAAFWATRRRRIAPWYLAQQGPDDVIISASPDFLLRPLVERWPVRALIATRMDPATGAIDGENCRGAEKLRRLNREVPGAEVRRCYSDSLSDLPLLEGAEYAFVVGGEGPVPLADHRPSALSMYVSLEFLRFLVVGVVNSVIGVALAWAFSHVIADARLAWVFGYALSLVPSYLLNSAVTFKTRSRSLAEFGRFCASYVPNFLVQLVCVVVLIEIVGVLPIVGYGLAVVIGMPLTFLLLKVFAFRRRVRT